MNSLRLLGWLCARIALLIGVLLVTWPASRPAVAEEKLDPLARLQYDAVREGKASWGYWGTDPARYSNWTSHSNRLIPVYTFGITLQAVKGEQSPYRKANELERLYGKVPEETLNPQADYFDQTDIYRLQWEAALSGKRYIVLVVFDGMDWQTTWAAALYVAGQVAYREGRGTGLLFQDYAAVPTDFGFMVTSPHNDGTRADVDHQRILNPGGSTPGGYDARRGGALPWSVPAEPEYLLGRSRTLVHAVTDSASSATSMTAGIKTYNDAINVDWQGRPVPTIAHRLQQRGFAIGVVTSVTISHATPACAYAHNVHRDDYQDIARDLVGLPSVSHPDQPLAGVDVLLGAGWGLVKNSDPGQGTNYQPGNPIIADSDLAAVDVRHGGRYRVVQRTAGRRGREVLDEAIKGAVAGNERLLGLFGTRYGHLPFQTGDGRFDPTISVSLKNARIETAAAEQYTTADVEENPSLADLTRAALEVLAARSDRFWLMVEAGDVDWANHANNVDNAVGAVLSGEAAFGEIVQWVERHQAWDEAAVIVTADHGHHLVITQPEVLAEAGRLARSQNP
ncbi:MAG: alkaline phosphatase [Pirellulaceae bacterium]|nr:MAG: alkaline phosphatase [Pirellulaceae bacterium]